MPQESKILGPYGEPVHIDMPDVRPLSEEEEHEWESVVRSAIYSTALRQIKDPAVRRAEDPYCTHPWVYASAVANSDNLSQVDFIIWHETITASQTRARQAVDRGYIKNEAAWCPGRGKKRTAVQRYLRNPRRLHGRSLKALEPDFDHPYAEVFRRPNFLMTGNDLWKATDIMYQLRGNAFWLVLTESGRPWFPGDPIDRIMILHPDDIVPMFDRSDSQLSAWKFTVSKKSEGLGLGPIGFETPYMVQEVIHFSNYNMNDPINGLAPLSPVAANVYQDMMVQQVNTALLENGADPGGYLFTEEPLDDKEKRKMIKKWHDRHGGPLNRKKMAVLSGKIDWKQTSLNPEEMQYSEMDLRNRESVMAVLRTNKSVLGLTEDINHATHLAQDRAFWQRSLLPRVKYYEGVVDMKIMGVEPDTTMAGFRLEDVDALQEDIKEKVTTVVELTGAEIHMAPLQALELVGIDTSDFDGGDEALLSPLLTTVKNVLEMAEEDPEDEEDLEDPEDEEDTDDEEEGDDEDEEEEEETAALSCTKKVVFAKPSIPAMRRGITRSQFRNKMRRNADKIRKAYTRLSEIHEKPYRGKYKSHVFNLRRQTLRNFDKIADAKKSIAKQDPLFTTEEIERILFDLEVAGVKITSTMLPLYQAILGSIVSFTEDEMGGLFGYDIAGENTRRFMDNKAILVRDVNKTIRANIRKAITQGLLAGEGLDAIRDRIKRAFNLQATSFRVLRVARTEVNQMMSGIRSIIFDEEGVSRVEWTTAGDELVRDDHVTLGSTGPRTIGFNWMEALGKEGTLLRPSDVNGPADQVINCRCVLIPVG